MTFSTPQQIARAKAPTGGHMQTPGYLEALVHKSIKQMDWRKHCPVEEACKRQIEREAKREMQIEKARQEKRRRAKLEKVRRVVEIATGKRDPEIIYVNARPVENQEYLKSPFRIHRLTDLFLERMNVGRRDVFSKDRFAGIVKTRRLLVWILRDTLKISTPALGKYMGQADHSTVFHHCKKVTDDPDLLNEAKAIQAAILTEERKTYGDSK